MLWCQRIYHPYQSAASCTSHAPATDQFVPQALSAADVQGITQVPQTSPAKAAAPPQLSLHPDLVPVEQLE